MLSDADSLRLQQLRLLEWLSSDSSAAGSDATEPVPERPVPVKWDLLPDFELSEWQKDCRDLWFSKGCKGTTKVVTGAGKTILALAIAQRLQNEVDSELRVAIVVPTVVLMNQWYDQLSQRTNLPATLVGRLGGGYKDDFSLPCRILISVLDSAQSKLPQIVEAAGVGEHLLFVADECHRAGAPEMKRVLSVARRYSLGLSATPERDDGEESDSDYDATLLGKELGGIIYELTLAEALRLGIVPPYSIRHYGLPLTPDERYEYETLSRSITDLRKELQNICGLPGTTHNQDWLCADFPKDVCDGVPGALRCREELGYEASPRRDDAGSR